MLKSAIALGAQLVLELALRKAIEATAWSTAAATAASTGGASTASGAIVGGLFGGAGSMAGGLLGRHTGGMITAHTGLFVPRRRSDEVDIRALSGEAVLNRSATRRLGGKAGIDRINRGEAGAGSRSNVSITINAAPGMSPNAVADAVMDKLMRESRRGRVVLNARGVEQ
jgi:hypothetical protein